MSTDCLQPMGEGLFIYETFIRFYGFALQTRMTVVCLGDGRLLVHSPLMPTEELVQCVESLGQVAFLVSPNKIHNMFIGDWARRYPHARVYASPGLPQRRPDLKFDVVLGNTPEPEWEHALDQAATAGNRFFSEIVFLHRSTGTLIVADLVESMTHETLGPAGRCLARAMGWYGRTVASPEHRLYTDDTKAAEQVFDRMLAWDFERIVLAHGRLVTSGGKQVLAKVCEQLLARATHRSGWQRKVFELMADRQ